MPGPGFAANAAVATARTAMANAATTVALAAVDLTCSPFVVSDAMSERTCSIEDRLPERTRVALVPARTAALLFALALAGCGGSESASHVAELGDYDATKPLRTKIEAENSGSTDITFQSPQGGDVEATIVLPPDAAKGSATRPRCTCTYRFSRALYYREAFDLATRGSPCCSSTRR